MITRPGTTGTWHDLPAFWLGVIGLAALLIAVGLGVVKPVSFFEGYLLAWIWWAGPVMGCAAWLMIHHLSGGAWGWSIRRPLVTGAGTASAAALLVVPIIWGGAYLLPWWPAMKPSSNEIIHFRSHYLTAAGYIGRSICYIVTWWLGAWMLWRATRRNSTYLRRLSAGGLIVYALTMSLAVIDFVGSMESHWYSSVYGLYAIVGQVVSGLAVVILVLAITGEMNRMHRQTLNDLGNLLLASVVIWAYLAYSQFFIVWNGDLPEQSEWYLQRSRGAWLLVAVAIILLHFLLPFAALLFRSVKRTVPTMTSVAAMVLVAHALDVSWMVGPAYRSWSAWSTAQTVICVFALGLLLLAAAAWFHSFHDIKTNDNANLSTEPS